MARKKKTEETVIPEEMAPTEANGPPEVTKMEAVRQALASGAESAEDAIPLIKERFGIEVTKPQFSTYKSVIKSKGGATGGKRTKKGKGGEGLQLDGALIDAALAVKELVRRHGADSVRRLVDVVE